MLGNNVAFIDSFQLTDEFKSELVSNLPNLIIKIYIRKILRLKI